MSDGAGKDAGSNCPARLRSRPQAPWDLRGPGCTLKTRRNAIRAVVSAAKSARRRASPRTSGADSASPGSPVIRKPSGSSARRSCSMPESLVRVERPTYASRSTTSTSPPSSVPGGSIETMVRCSASCAATVAVSGRRDSAPGRVIHREVVDHDRRVLDEHRVRQRRFRWQLPHGSAEPGQPSLVFDMLGSGVRKSIGCRARWVTGESTIDGLSGRVRASSIRWRRVCVSGYQAGPIGSSTGRSCDGIAGAFHGETRGDARAVLGRAVGRASTCRSARTPRSQAAIDVTSFDVARRRIGHLPGLAR